MAKKKLRKKLLIEKDDEKKSKGFDLSQNTWLTGILIASLFFILTCIFFHSVTLRPGYIPWGDQDSETARILTDFLRTEFMKFWKYPLWNPYIFSGMPTIDSLTYPAYYPLWLIYTLFPDLKSIFHHISLHIFLTGIFTYLLGRFFSLGRIESIFISIGYMFTGYTVTLTFSGHGGKIWTCAYIPLVFGLFKKSMESRKNFHILLAGLVTGLQILAGHVQIVFYTWVINFLYLVFIIFRVFSEKSDRHNELKKFIPGAITILLSVFIIGFSVASVQLLPLLKYSKWSNRSNPGYEYLSSYSYPPEELITFVMPGFFCYGDPDFDEKDPDLPAYWGRLAIRGSTEFIGVTIFFCSLLALFYYNRFWLMNTLKGYAILFILLILFNIPFIENLLKGISSGFPLTDFKLSTPVNMLLFSMVVSSVFSVYCRLRKRLPNQSQTNEELKPETNFFLALTVISMILSFGDNTPIYPLVAKLPGFNKFRAPAQINILVSFAMVMLAGVGLYVFNRLEDKKVLNNMFKNASLIGLVLIIALGAAYLGKSCFPQIIQSNIEPVQGDPPDIATVLFRYNIAIKEVFYFTLVWLLLTSILYCRFKGITSKNMAAFLIIFILCSELFIVGNRFIIPIKEKDKFREFDQDKIFEFFQKDKTIFRIYNADIKQVDINEPVYHRIFSLTGYHGAPMSEYWKLMTNDNQGFIYKFLDMMNVKYIIFGSRLGESHFKQVFKERSFVYENLRKMPRAYMVFNTKVFDNKDDILKFMESNEFNPRSIALLGKKAVANFSGQGEWSTEIKEISPHKVSLKVKTEKSGFLVLAEVFYPGWHVSVDGENREIYKTNCILRGTPIEKGDHDVIFTFDPLINKVGFFISILTFLGVVFFIGRNLKKDRFGRLK